MGITAEYNSKKNLNNNNLSAIFDSDSFFYALTTDQNELVKAVKYSLEGRIEDEIIRIVENEKLANYSYKNLNLFSKSSNFCFVPDSEYSYNSEQVFMQNCFPPGIGETAVDIVNDEGLRILHEHIEFGFSSILEIQKSKQIKHLSSAWLNLHKQNGVHLFFGDDQLSILVVSNDKFQYYNQFYHTGFEDAFYFTMLSFDQLELLHESSVIYLDGPNPQKTELADLLSDYVQNVSYYKGGFSNLKDSSDFLDLYAISICE